MNNRQKQVLQYQLDKEKEILEELEKQYEAALQSINEKLAVMYQNDMTQSRIYQAQYQEALKKQIAGVLEKLHGDQYTSLEQFLTESYKDAFIGTMYDFAGQGVPLVIPIDQDAAAKAIVLDSKINEGLYDSLGIDANNLKKTIRQEITRGISTQLPYADIARNISMASKAPLSRAKTIARTESHRIQQAATYDSQQLAKSKGAKVVKQWDSVLDGNTRNSHMRLDGQIREVDKPFEYGNKKAMFPGDFGDPAEDCNCRCVSLTRSIKMLDESELQTLKDRAEYFGLDKTDDFKDFEKKYLTASENSGILFSSGNGESFSIGKSLGAKSKNYDIYDPDTGDSFRFVEGSNITAVKVFAGYKGVKALAEATVEGLAEQIGGSPEKWQHAKGIGLIDFYGEERKAEVHWFQEETVGKHKFKVKEWIDE